MEFEAVGRRYDANVAQSLSSYERRHGCFDDRGGLIDGRNEVYGRWTGLIRTSCSTSARRGYRGSRWEDFGPKVRRVRHDPCFTNPFASERSVQVLDGHWSVQVCQLPCHLDVVYFCVCLVLVLEAEGFLVLRPVPL